MDIGTILGLLGSLLGGGALGAVVTSYFSSKSEDKKTEVDASDRLISQWEKLLQPLRDRVTDLENKLEEARLRELEYKSEISSLKNQLIIFESSHVDIPLAMWMKDTSGKMVFLNAIYEDMFLIPRGLSMYDYVGKFDKDVWSDEVAREFGKHDKEVIRTKKYVRHIEKIDDGTGGFVYADVLKYPRMLNNKVIGISGIVMELSKDREKLTHENCKNK